MNEKPKMTFEEAFEPMARLIARKIMNDIRKEYEDMHPEETARINQKRNLTLW